MIELVDVSARDGLQNEPVTLATHDKVALIGRIVAAGVRRLEVASFVHPGRVPQMADAEAVLAALPRLPGIRHIGLVLNERGAERALATGVDELGIVCAASDTFSHANQGMSADTAAAAAEAVLIMAGAVGRAAQVTIAVAFSCPFEGPVDPARVVMLARRFAAAGAIEVALADTIGVARPAEVARLVTAVRRAVRPLPVRVHVHDTRGTGVANSVAAVAAGATTVDAAVGGVGGCPFAPGAAGNVASEELAYALGDEVTVDVDALVDTATWLNARLGRIDTSAMMRATAAARVRTGRPPPVPPA